MFILNLWIHEYISWELRYDIFFIWSTLIFIWGKHDIFLSGVQCFLFEGNISFIWSTVIFYLRETIFFIWSTVIFYLRETCNFFHLEYSDFFIWGEKDFFFVWNKVIFLSGGKVNFFTHGWKNDFFCFVFAKCNNTK